MKKTNLKNISIGFNCSEDYEGMPNVSGEKYCLNCQKSITDFSEYNTDEIIDFFENNHRKNCAKISQDQLFNVNKLIQENSRSQIHPYVKSGLLVTTMLASSCSSNKSALTDCSDYESSYEIVQPIESFKKDKVTVEGVIVDESDMPLVGVTYVTDNNEINNSHTNIDGKFRFELDTVKMNEKEFEANYIGYQSIKIRMNEIKNQEIKIVLREDVFLLGDIIVERQPIHKRLWNSLANIFR